MIVILSGPSGSGKSSACAILIELYSQSGAPCGGVLCRAVFQEGHKVGIELAVVGTENPVIQLAQARPGVSCPTPLAGQRRPRPTVPDDEPGTLRYGMWDFSIEALNLADDAGTAFLSAPYGHTRSDESRASEPPLLIVDEIGPLELDYDMGMIRTLSELDRLATGAGEDEVDCIVCARPDIAARLRTRWPLASEIMAETNRHKTTATTLLSMLRAKPTGVTASV
ncbi:MAG: hypothetical protein JXM71_10505 [Spirochaetales bacterium]|nr:hypothetical protein [Spirochaetales bacterium]